MLMKTSCRRFLDLTEKHKDLIGDLSTLKMSEISQIKKESKLIYRILSNNMQFVTFNPFSIVKMTWDFFILFIMVFLFISVPLLLSTGKSFE